MAKCLYLIEYNTETIVVAAEDSQEALNSWITKVQEECERDWSKVKFQPKDFRVKELCNENLVIRAPK
ncbi:hypothetical protein [Bacillus sp. 165]|uniref:hypothetical protein n=1 Tax=Bacillus sp. 165 TaxID=1529117 RepID=UPI001ADB3CF9|nr:hypothetical protein [Bacillus sp. 165]MBO9128958.1 hypothetical protein [Bacillus sp. 165]